MYDAVFSLKTGWIVGKIQDHVAKPLTEDEVKEICNRLNNFADVKSKSATKTCYAENGEQALKMIYDEYLKSCNKHIAAFRSTHEGYAVIKEELEELWDEVKKDDYDNCYKETVQVGAMALKFLLSRFSA